MLGILVTAIAAELACQGQAVARGIIRIAALAMPRGKRQFWRSTWLGDLADDEVRLHGPLDLAIDIVMGVPATAWTEWTAVLLELDHECDVEPRSSVGMNAKSWLRVASVTLFCIALAAVWDLHLPQPAMSGAAVVSSLGFQGFWVVAGLCCVECWRGWEGDGWRTWDGYAGVCGTFGLVVTSIGVATPYGGIVWAISVGYFPATALIRRRRPGYLVATVVALPTSYLIGASDWQSLFGPAINPVCVGLAAAISCIVAYGIRRGMGRSEDPTARLYISAVLAGATWSMVMLVVGYRESMWVTGVIAVISVGVGQTWGHRVSLAACTRRHSRQAVG